MMAKKPPFQLRMTKQDSLERDPRHWRARIKRDDKRTTEQIQSRRLLERAKLLQKSRSEASLARGINIYREAKGLSRGEMAESLGVTRRALFNYEEGRRSVPGKLLETLVKRGDAELHEFFAIPVEPANGEQRKNEARLAIALFRKCKAEFPEAEDVHLEDIAADRAAHWQHSVKATPNNIAKLAAQAVEELKDQYHDEALCQELFNGERERRDGS